MSTRKINDLRPDKKPAPLIVVSEEELERMIPISNEDNVKIAKIAEIGGCSWESAACVLLHTYIGMAQTNKQFWDSVVAGIKKRKAKKK